MDGLEGATQMAADAGAEYPVLADPQGTTVRDYGVYDLLGDGMSAPATFIIGKDGTYLSGYVGKSIADRPSAEDILQQLRKLLGQET